MYYTVRVQDDTKVRAKKELIAEIDRCISRITTEQKKMQDTLRMIDRLAHGSATGADRRLLGECERGLQAAQMVLYRLNGAKNAACSLDTTKEVTVYAG